MVSFAISPPYTYILFQNAYEDNFFCICVHVCGLCVCIYCEWAHMGGAHRGYVVSMEDIEKVDVRCLLLSLNVLKWVSH